MFGQLQMQIVELDKDKDNKKNYKKSNENQQISDISRPIS